MQGIETVHKVKVGRKMKMDLEVNQIFKVYIYCIWYLLENYFTSPSPKNIGTLSQSVKCIPVIMFKVILDVFTRSSK